MNPLKSITGTIILGFVTAIVIALLVGGEVVNALWSLVVGLHVFFGIIWIGLLYYFNFVQVPAVGEAVADSDDPGPAAISKYVAPRALLWFRWTALLTWLTGAATLEIAGWGIMDAFTLQPGVQVIGIGSVPLWLSIIVELMQPAPEVTHLCSVPLTGKSRSPARLTRRPSLPRSNG